MSEYDDLDPLFIPSTDVALDKVAARVHTLRFRRRASIAGAAGVLVVAAIASAAFATGGKPHSARVNVANEGTTTTETPVTDADASTPTSLPDVTATTDGSAPDSTDTTQPPATDPLPPPTDTTTTTVHDPHDLSMLTVNFGADDAIGVPSGGTRLINYTVTNEGSWTVSTGDCVDFESDVWANPGATSWPPYTNGIWPAPYPVREGGGMFCADIAREILPGASYTQSETVLGGYRNQAGDVMPSPPGYTSFSPIPFAQCTQPCAEHAPNSVTIIVYPPTWPPPPSLYTLDVLTMHMTAASGGSTQAEVTYTNGLAYTVKVPIFGPCWTVKSGAATVDCSGDIPAIVIGPHETVDLVGTLWARAGFKATGAPLSPGRHYVNLGDHMSETLQHIPAESVYLDVT